MIHGLLWLPLLFAFFWLAWSGWNEYQKIEAYRLWAGDFERAKYDIYSVLGQKGDDLTWGKPTRKSPIDLQTFSLKEVKKINLLVDSKVVDLEKLPNKGREIALEFVLSENSESIKVPFTEIPLAAEWGKFLQKEFQRLHPESSN
ncbi:MAG: hypothetical protein WA828_02865 [Coleofasciculaceae cyanobacterium]